MTYRIQKEISLRCVPTHKHTTKISLSYTRTRCVYATFLLKYDDDMRAARTLMILMIMKKVIYINIVCLVFYYSVSDSHQIHTLTSHPIDQSHRFRQNKFFGLQMISEADAVMDLSHETTQLCVSLYLKCFLNTEFIYNSFFYLIYVSIYQVIDIYTLLY